MRLDTVDHIDGLCLIPHGVVEVGDLRDDESDLIKK